MSSSSNSACGIVEKLLNYLQARWFFLTSDLENLFEPVTPCANSNPRAIFQQLSMAL
jgi:hypothetical protein